MLSIGWLYHRFFIYSPVDGFLHYSRLLLLWRVLLWTFSYIFPTVNVQEFLLGIYQRVELLVIRYVSVWHQKITTNLSKVVLPFHSNRKCRGDRSDVIGVNIGSVSINFGFKLCHFSSFTYLLILYCVLTSYATSLSFCAFFFWKTVNFHLANKSIDGWSAWYCLVLFLEFFMGSLQ